MIDPLGNFNPAAAALDAGGNVIEKAGSALDKNITSDDERQKNELEAGRISAGIHAMDMRSDSRLAKIVRPWGFISTLHVFHGMLILVTLKLLFYDFTGSEPTAAESLRLQYTERIAMLLWDIFKYLILCMANFYFISRLIEKRARIKAGGIYEPKTELQKKGVKGWFKSLWGGDENETK